MELRAGDRLRLTDVRLDGLPDELDVEFIGWVGVRGGVAKLRPLTATHRKVASRYRDGAGDWFQVIPEECGAVFLGGAFSEPGLFAEDLL